MADAQASMIDSDINLEDLNKGNANRGRLTTPYWDDTTADVELIKKIQDYQSNFYSCHGVGFSNHKNLNKYTSTKPERALAAYDGDAIENTETFTGSYTELNRHAYMTCLDLVASPSVYSRSSLLSAGLTESVWKDSVVGVTYTEIGSDGKEHTYNYFTDEEVTSKSNQQSQSRLA